MEPTWADTREYLASLEAMLAGGSDHAEALTALRTARTELQSIFTAAQSNAKRILTDLQHCVDRLESATADTVTPIEQLRLQTAQLETKRIKLLEQIARLQQERDVSAASMQRLLASTIAYKDQLAELSAQQAAEVPKRRHWLSLYANITAIRWDYDSPGDSLEGYIAPADKAVRPFRFNTRHLSGPALADALWSAVGQAHGLPQ